MTSPNLRSLSANSHTYYYRYSITHSFFHSRLKTFSANLSHCSLSFSSSGFTTVWGYCLLLLLSIFRLLLFSFFLFLHFSVVSSVRQIKLTHVGFQAHVKVASRIVYSFMVCYSGAARGEGGSFLPLWVDVKKLCNMYVLSLSCNFFVSHNKYIARLSSKEPRWYTDNTTGTGGLRTLDPL